MHIYSRRPEFSVGLHEIEWEEVIDKIPRLDDQDPKSHIRIAYRGKLVPWSPGGEEVISPLRIVHSVEILGPPNIGKTTLINSVSEELTNREFPHEIYTERDIGVDPYWDDEDFDMVFQLDAAALLMRNSINSATWVEEKNKKLKIYDRNIFSPLTFSLAIKNLRSRLRTAENLDLQLELAKSLYHYLDTIVIVNAPPQTSLERGSRMTPGFLSELYQVHLKFPEFISWLTADKHSPITIVQIDGDLSPEASRDLTLKSLGTILHARYERSIQLQKLTDPGSE